MPTPRLRPTPFLAFVFILAALLAAHLPLRAQTAAATGTVSGRVFHPATDSYVEGARVTVEGTSLETFTDDDGSFLLTGVPAGDARIRIFYTGSAPRLDTVRVTAGQTAPHDVSLTAVGATSPTSTSATGPVKLDAFTVATSKEMEGAAIAINEQRFASNIKNVVSTDEFGAVAEGNVTEFLKYLPGVTVDLSGGDGRTISVEGAPAANTPITLGGIGLSSPTGTGRGIEVGFFNLNNISRIEVSHSPTPDSPGKSLAGSINLVPRSSFERSRPIFNGSLYFLMRDDYRDLGKGAAMYRDRREKVWPGADFSWVVPVNKRFGFSVAAGASTQYSSQDRSINTWRGVSAVTNGTATAVGAFPNTVPGRPYLSAYQVNDAPKESDRDSLGLTLDFRLSARDRLALSYQYSSFDGWISSRQILFAPTQIVASSISPTSVQGVAGVGVLTLTNGNNRVRENRTYMPTFTWRHDGPLWKFDFATGRSYGKNAIRDMDKERFLSVTARRTGVTIGFEDTGYLRPATVTVVDSATKNPLNPYLLSNYALNTLVSTPQRASDVNFTATGNARRDFVWQVPFTLRTGLDFRQTRRDSRSSTATYTYRNNTTNGTAAPFLDPLFSTRFAPFGFPQIQHLDSQEVFAYWRTHQNEFTLDENNLYRTGVTNSKFAEESVAATYLRGDVALLNRRLLLVGGLRAEQTNIRADGPLTDLTLNVQRDAAGNPLRTATGAVIPITTNALETSKLTFLERAAHVQKEYLRLFPSLNATYHLRENLLLRAAVSTSIGPPNFNQYAGGLTLPNTDNLPAANNRIVVNNAAIKPWTANTVKVRLEYYFEGVGQVSVGAFRRHFKNFFVATVFQATPDFLTLYGLDPGEYGDYDVSTQRNATETIRMEGLDVSYRQSLTFLPRWARGLQVFANGSLQRSNVVRGQLAGNEFNEIPRNAAWGFSFTRPRYNLRLNWTWRADQNQGPVTGLGIEPGTFNYTPGYTKLDVLGEFSLRKNLSLFANLRNVTDVPDKGTTVGPSTPQHATLRFVERYGSLWTLGIKGTF